MSLKNFPLSVIEMTGPNLAVSLAQMSPMGPEREQDQDMECLSGEAARPDTGSCCSLKGRSS